MNIQQLFDNALAAQRAEEMKVSEQLTLGELIWRLESFPSGYRVVIDRYPAQFATRLDSWRGRYAELALGYTTEQDDDRGVLVTVADLLENAKAALGQTFEGYKGGDFLMGKTTPVWVANYGDSNYLEHGYPAITGVSQDGETVVIQTKEMD